MAWDLARLLALLEKQIPESDEIDFKAKAALCRPMTQDQHKELSKDVSAFANHPGGTIVFGAVENKSEKGKDRTIARFEGYSDGEMDADWIENKFRTLVDNPLSRINATRILINGEFVFVVEIGKSPLAPHMAKDGRYYIRSGASSRFASHLEVEGIRHSGAPIDLGLEFYEGSTHGKAPHDVTVNAVVRNKGGRAVRGVYFSVSLPEVTEVRWDEIYKFDPLPVTLRGHIYRRYSLLLEETGQHVLYPGQASKPVRILRAKSTTSVPLSTLVLAPQRIRIELQSLDGFYSETEVEFRDLLVMISTPR